MAMTAIHIHLCLQIKLSLLKTLSLAPYWNNCHKFSMKTGILEHSDKEFSSTQEFFQVTPFQ